jgi:hypothetical protein
MAHPIGVQDHAKWLVLGVILVLLLVTSALVYFSGASSQGVRAESVKALVETKTLAPLIRLLELNGIDHEGISGIATKQEPGSFGAVAGAGKVRSKGADYVVAIAEQKATLTKAQEKQSLAPVFTERAFLFTPDGDFIGTLGGGFDSQMANGESVSVISLGTMDCFFIWITLPTREGPFNLKSKLYLVGNGLPLALDVLHFTNSTAVTSERSAESFLWFRGRRGDLTHDAKAVGSDGLEHLPRIYWDSNKSRFVGPSELELQDGSKLYRVDVSTSRLFEPTDHC